MSEEKNLTPTIKEFIAFLNKFKTNNADIATHYMMSGTCGKFHIPNNDKKTFHNLYMEAIKDKLDIALIEKHKNQGPIVVDIDIKYKGKTERIMREELVESIIKIYNRCINEVLDVPEHLFLSWLFMKKKPTIKDGITKDGFHLMYPTICATIETKLLIRKRVVDKILEEGLFGGMDLLEGVNEIVDEAVIERNGWMMYGSKKPDGFKYTLFRIYNYAMEIKKKEEIIGDKNLADILSVRKYGATDLTPFKESYTHDIVEQECFKLGLIKYESEDLPEDFTVMEQEKIKEMKKEDGKEDQNIKKARTLVKLLSIHRAVDYKKWIELGWCLHNVSHMLLSEWVEFSKLCPDKFKKGECERLWKTFRDDGYNIGSLYLWAKSDNPEGYRKFRETDTEIFYERAVSSQGEASFARLVREEYKYEYVCADIKNNLWFEFRGHKWEEIDSAFTLRIKLTEEMPKHLWRLHSKWGNDIFTLLSKTTEIGGEGAQEEIKKQQEKIQAKIANVTKLMTKLEASKFRDNIIKDCKILFYDQNFLNKLNEKRHLICFENGVYDLDRNEFRNGRPDDYISFTTGCNYYPTNDARIVERVKELENLLMTIHGEIDLYNYTMTFYASCLQGNPRDELFHILTGTGANGKSVEQALIAGAFGDYFGTMSVTFLTRKTPDANTAQPGLADKKGKRIVIFNEPDANDNINVSQMKYFSGGDKVSARKLYQAPIEFFPQFRFMLLCNDLPGIPSTDGGTWRRIRVVPFKRKFLPKEEMKKDDPTHILRDNTVKEKIMTGAYNEAFMSLLVEFYNKIYKKEGLKPPAEVLKYTTQYQENSNSFLLFYNEKFVKTDNNKDIIDQSEALALYRSWSRIIFGRPKEIKKSEFITQMNHVIGKKDWKGYVLKVEEDGNNPPKVSKDEMS